MAEDSESGPPSGQADDESAESDGATDDGGFDPETDRVYSPGEEDVPGGSIEDYLDDDETVAADERAPMGATGTADPFDEDERRSVSDAVGAPVPDSELEEEPELDLDPSVATAEDGDSVVESDSTAEERGDAVAEPDSVDEAAASAPEPTPTDGSEAATADPTAATDGDVVDDGLVGEGPASDEEMPLAAHIEEMVRRLAVVLVVGGVVALAVFPVADQLINFLWNSHIPGAETITDRRPRLYGPLELVVTELKVAALAGFVVGLPIAVYETYLFMRPGLFPRERRYYLAAVPTSLVLALIGVAFAHFVVLPAIFAYFTAYTTGTAVVAFGLKETFSLILVLMGYMALVFQIPLFIMLAIMMNLTTRIWLEDRRLLFWGGFLGVAFLVSPDPTGMAPIIVAATMISLFEGTLALLRWTGN